MSRSTTTPAAGCDVASAPNATYAFTRAFFEELARSGVEHVCVSPGSRSTPLAVTAASVASLRVWSQLDERAAAFFALGLAKASRKPVALVCTSGTALANYAPAVIEAHYAQVPLVVLSADRPPELREWGAGQTIDQQKFFGAQVRYFAELAIPEAGSRMLRYARAMACRAVGESQGTRPGPVHLNWPLREPLEPLVGATPGDHAQGDVIALHGRPDGQPYAHCARVASRASVAQVEELAEIFSHTERGVIACGMLDEPDFADAVSRLAQLLGWPLLADPISGVRSGAHLASAPVLAGYDLFLRDQTFQAAHRPQVVLRFGATPTCKAFRLWLEAVPPERVVVVSAGGDWNEPSHLTSDFIVADPTQLCRELVEALEGIGTDPRHGEWTASFLEAEVRTQAVLERELVACKALFEPHATRLLCERLPHESILYVSNSMPVRDLDAFMPLGQSSLRVLANRGANGIDGMVSSALGASAAGEGHVFLLTGDLAFLYDVGGLLAARRYPLRATIVVFNNDGGGIFSFLPIAAYGEAVRFDELFNTPHGVDFSAAAKLYDLQHTRVDTPAQFSSALEKSVSHGGVSLIEVPIDGDSNRDHFRALVREVSRALEGDGGAR
ncbi:MAG: 2-succinyl-5-enolpyruvyl-6-hydroxy-3-cyclohexene-1-carboxylic-acid synthase [bacterium]|nr:2-succinyl-5-enolpyruvyl-6-hydroxy-3-cyclohexene-1-carboxylic-acid synthase [bacterium]